MQYIKPLFTFIDLFSGIGGFRLGFEKAGGTCVFSSEIDKYARQVYSKNFNASVSGDITNIEPYTIPDHDILLAGFPCQPFSRAGLNLGMEDERGNLFFNIAEIMKVKKPKWAVLENVKGLISHDKGNTLLTILKTLTSIGYRCNIPNDIIEHGSLKEIQELAKNMVLNSKDFGVPQNRQRIYIVLWQEGLVDSFEYPTPPCTPTSVGSILETTPSPKLTISDKAWAGHQRRTVANKLNGKGFGYSLVKANTPYTNTLLARYYKDGWEILVEQQGENPRRLSPREAARLQGFPDTFTLPPSATQAYKQLGNSITIPVVEAVALKVKEAMLKRPYIPASKSLDLTGEEMKATILKLTEETFKKHANTFKRLADM